MTWGHNTLHVVYAAGHHPAWLTGREVASPSPFVRLDDDEYEETKRRAEQVLGDITSYYIGRSIYGHVYVQVESLTPEQEMTFSRDFDPKRISVLEGIRIG